MTEISPHVTQPTFKKSYQAAMENVSPMAVSSVTLQEKFKSTKLDSLPSTATPTLDESISCVHEWQVEDVVNWAAKSPYCSLQLIECLQNEQVDGQVLLVLTEEDLRDMRYKLRYNLTFGELKKFWLSVVKLQFKEKQLSLPVSIGISGHLTQAACTTAIAPSPTSCPCPLDCPNYVSDCEAYLNATKKSIPPEYLKTAISLGYSFVVTWITSFVMVIVHERVPDMKRYPPLPDIFLDNVPHIPWAFNMCEITGTLLFSIWMVVIVFHKYRTVLLRRFFALAGTVFLLRCVTMLITSLSVPGTHLQCNQKDFAIEDPDLDLFGALWIRMRRAYTIWSGLGMSIQGVRTCGDYMFSGHTVALTLLNFFITEYTPRNLYFLHTLTWLLNMFGIFFILAAHEHYSIDVFVAFYITSRLFLYYHTLANNQALMQSDSTRTRIWFPMFSYFESSVEGIIPNIYDSFATIVDNILHPLSVLKDGIMLTAYRIWLDPPILRKTSEHLLNGSSPSAKEVELKHQNPTATTFYSISSPHVSGPALSGHRHQTTQSLSCQEELDLQKNEVLGTIQTASPKSVGTVTSFDTEIKDFKTKKQL